MNELAIITFHDAPARRREALPAAPEGSSDIPGRRAEAAACTFLLEHRAGPRGFSLTGPDRLLLPNRGRSLPTVDVEATVQQLEKAIRVLPEDWRGPVVVHLGWNIGVQGIRDEKPEDGGPPFLERGGFPLRYPAGLTRHALQRRGRDLRDELISRGLISRGARRLLEEDDVPQEPRAFSPEERARMPVPEQPLIGWSEIAQFLGVSVATARRWADELDLPFSQPSRGRRVRAYPSVLRAWDRAHVSADEHS